MLCSVWPAGSCRVHTRALRQHLGLGHRDGRLSLVFSCRGAASMAGVPLYEVFGYVQVEPILSAPVDGVQVPLVRMEKTLA